MTANTSKPTHSKLDLVGVPAFLVERVAYVITVEESEAGWGTRHDGYVYTFSTKNVRKFIDQCQEGKKAYPREFSYPVSIRLLQLTEEGHKKVVAAIKEQKDDRPWLWTKEKLFDTKAMEVLL